MARKKKIIQDNYNAAFPSRLRECVKNRGVTQSDIATALGKSRQAIGYYMDGTSSPDWETLVDLAKYLNVSADYLLGLSPYMDKEKENLTAPDMGLTEGAAAILSTYQKTGSAQMLNTLNSLIEAEATAHGYSPLQAIAAYLFFGKKIERIYKITDNGMIIEKKVPSDDESDIKRAFLVDSSVGTLLTIDDDALFNEALYNVMCQSLRDFKTMLRQRAEEDNSITGADEET